MRLALDGARSPDEREWCPAPDGDAAEGSHGAAARVQGVPGIGREIPLQRGAAGARAGAGTLTKLGTGTLIQRV